MPAAGPGGYGWGTVILLGGLAAVGPVRGGEWDLTPRIRVAETFTDNVALASSGADWELITQVTPGISLEGRGRRADLDLSYQMQNLFYARKPERSATYHQLGAEGSMELWRRTLFLDGEATRSQQILDAGGRVPSTNLGVTANRRDVTTYSAGPRLQYALGSFARLRASHRMERVEFERRLEDRTQQTTRASLASGPRFNRVGWSLAYDRRRETIDSVDGAPGEQVLQRGRGEVNVQLGGKTQVFGAGGYEDNSYPRAVGREPPEGEFWEAGLRWRPTARTFLEGSYGERFFGKTWGAVLRHQAPDASLTLSYSESLVTQTDLRIRRSQSLVRDEEGNIVLAPDGDPLVIDVPVPTVTTEVFLQKRTHGRIGWQTGKTTLGVTAFTEEREYQTRELTEEIYGGHLQLNWGMAPRTDVNGRIRWQRQSFAGLDRTDRWWSVRGEIRQQATPSLHLSGSYEHLERVSNAGGRDYASNLLTVALDKTF